MLYKTEQIDALAKRFNSVNKSLKETVNELIQMWDDTQIYHFSKKLKKEFDEFQEHLKAFLVEVRLNILLLDDKSKLEYKMYCQVSLNGFSDPITPEKIEAEFNNAFGSGALSFDDSFYNADVVVSQDIQLYEACNYVFCYSLLLNYYKVVLLRIADGIPVVNVGDADLELMDSKKSTINQKSLALYYLVYNKKIDLNKISQDTTKQAKVFSFLFDNGYDNLRKSLGNIQESSVSKIKTKQNLERIAILFSDLGTEFTSVNEHIKKDINSLE